MEAKKKISEELVTMARHVDNARRAYRHAPNIETEALYGDAYDRFNILRDKLRELEEC